MSCRFVHVIANDGIFFFLKTNMLLQIYIHLYTDTHLGRFHVSTDVSSNPIHWVTDINSMYDLLSFGYVSEMEFLDHNIVLYIFKEPLYRFPVWYNPVVVSIYIPNGICVPISQCNSIIILCVFSSYSNKWGMVSYCGFNCISDTICDIQCFFINPLAT